MPWYNDWKLEGPTVTRDALAALGSHGGHLRSESPHYVPHFPDVRLILFIHPFVAFMVLVRVNILAIQNVRNADSFTLRSMKLYHGETAVDHVFISNGSLSGARQRLSSRINEVRST